MPSSRLARRALDELKITEHQNKLLKCEVKPVERNVNSTNAKTNQIDELNRRELNTYYGVFEMQF